MTAKRAHVLLHCPRCNLTGHLRVMMPATYAIKPGGGINPHPVAFDEVPDRKDPAFCVAEGCEWLGQYRDLVDE